MLMPFRLFPNPSTYQLPLALYSCGLHEQNYQYRPLGYPTLQCFISFGGYGTFRFRNDQELVLAPNHALLLPAKAAHEYYPGPGETWLLGFIGIHGTSVESMIQGFGLPFMTSIPLNPAALDVLNHKLTTIWQASIADSPGIQGKLSVQLYEFLLLLSEHVISHKHPILPNPLKASQDALDQAVQFMKQHYDENLHISNIAHAVGYSVQHFQRIFREAYGINPHAYLQRIRLEQAAAWLEGNPEYSVQEISHRLGMEASYFIRIFKKKYGVTPRSYRNAYAYRHQLQ